jgi:hypothetical protein
MVFLPGSAKANFSFSADPLKASSHISARLQRRPHTGSAHSIGPRRPVIPGVSAIVAATATPADSGDGPLLLCCSGEANMGRHSR